MRATVKEVLKWFQCCVEFWVTDVPAHDDVQKDELGKTKPSSLVDFIFNRTSMCASCKLKC